MVTPGASLPQVIYEHSIEASYRGEVLTLVNSELSNSHIAKFAIDLRRSFARTS